MVSAVPLRTAVGPDTSETATLSKRRSLHATTAVAHSPLWPTRQLLHLPDVAAAGF